MGRTSLARAIALPRLRAQPGVLVAVVVSVLVATTLLATGPVLSTALAEAGLRARLEQAAADEIGVEVEVRTAASRSAAAAVAAAEAVQLALGPLVGVPDVLVRTGTVRIEGTAGDLVAIVGGVDVATPLPGDDRAPPEPLFVVDGATVAADGTVPVRLHPAALARLDAAVGDELQVVGGARLTVVGTVAAADPADPRWWADAQWRDGVARGQSFTTVGPLVPADGPVAGRAGVIVGEDDPRVVVTVRALPPAADVRPAVLSTLLDRAATLPGEVRRALAGVVDPGEDRWTVATPIVGTAAATSVQLGSTRASVLAIVVQVAVLALYALGLAGRLLRSGRDVETMLLRARGATPAQLGVAALVEGLVVVLPVVAVAPYTAVWVTRVLGGLDVVEGAGLVLAPRPSFAALAAAGVAAVACLGLLVWPAVTAARRTYATARGARGRRRVTTVVQTAGIDLALVAVAALGVWQLRAAGSPVAPGSATPDVGVDLVLVVAPALGLLAGALLVLRLVPVLARLGERLVARRRGLVASLSGWQVARRPDAVSRPTLLLVLGVAIGVLVTTYATTWQVSQRDQAEATVGADAVAVADRSAGSLPPAETATALAAVDGVAAVAPTVTATTRLPGGGRTGTLVAFGAAEPLLLVRDDVAPTVPLRALDVPPVDGVPLPPGGALTATATLARDPTWPGRAVEVAVLVRDGDGLVHRLDDLPVAAGAPVELAWDVADVRPPAVLLAVEAATLAGRDDGAGSVVVPEGTTDPTVIAGLPAPRVDLRVDAVAVDDTAVPLGDRRWLPDPLEQVGVASRPPAVEALTVDGDGVSARADVGLAPPGNRSIVLRVAVADAGGGIDADTGLVPAVVHPDVLEASGRAVGEELELAVGAARLPLLLLGTAEVVPGAVDEPLPVMVDLDALAASRWRQLRIGTSADAWQLDVEGVAAADGGDAAATLAASRALSAELAGGVIQAPDVATTVLDTARRSSDPIAVGLVVALALGAIAAVALALLGTVTAAAVGVRERAAEFALLQAVGTSMRQIRLWLASEVAVVVLTGLVAGGLLGASLVWAVLPTLGLSADGSIAVPAPRVVVPVSTLVASAVVVVGSFALVPLGLARTVSRAHVAEVLRLGEDG